jgi:hypothetical protein
MENEDNLDKFDEYLKNVVSEDKLESIKNEINAIIKSCKEIKLINVEVEDIFISNFIKDDNEDKKQYDDLWLFSEDYWLEAREFETKSDYIIINPKSIQVSYINIKNKDYKGFKQARDSSKMSLYIYLNNDLLLNLKAAGRNCDHLKEIFLKYFLPHFKQSQKEDIQK